MVDVKPDKEPETNDLRTGLANRDSMVDFFCVDRLLMCAEEMG